MTLLPPDLDSEIVTVVERWSRGESIDVPTLRQASLGMSAYIASHGQLLPGQVAHLSSIGGALNQDATVEESRRILAREGLT